MKGRDAPRSVPGRCHLLRRAALASAGGGDDPLAAGGVRLPAEPELPVGNKYPSTREQIAQMGFLGTITTRVSWPGLFGGVELAGFSRSGRGKGQPHAAAAAGAYPSASGLVKLGSRLSGSAQQPAQSAGRCGAPASSPQRDASGSGTWLGGAVGPAALCSPARSDPPGAAPTAR